jgi:hypothetical protein
MEGGNHNELCLALLAGEPGHAVKPGHAGQAWPVVRTSPAVMRTALGGW